MFQNYSKTIAGLIIIIVGWIGLGEIVTEAEIGQLIDALIQAVGIVMAWVGRYQKGDIKVFGRRK